MKKSTRGNSGKQVRYEQATEKYRLFQMKKDRITQMDTILTGKKSDVVIPKTGEFFVVSSEPSLLPSLSQKHMNIQGDQRMMASTASHAGISSQIMSANSMYNIKKPLTDRKKKINFINRNSSQTLVSATQPNAVISSKIGAGGPKASRVGKDDSFILKNRQGEISKSMFLHAIKEKSFRNQRQSYDFLPGKGGNFISNEQNIANDVSQPANFERLSQISALKLQEAEQTQPIDQKVKRKQLEVLSNPTLTTSLTTNIRNIMRNQDKGLLTTSSRLLNAQVKRAELKSQIQKYESSLSPKSGQRPEINMNSKAISTIELLRRSKNFQTRSQSQSNKNAAEIYDLQQHTINTNQSMPQLQPMENTHGASVDFQTINQESSEPTHNPLAHEPDFQVFSHRDPLMMTRLNPNEAYISLPNRPGSTVLMQLGDKDTKRLVKKKFDLGNARQRPPAVAQSHTYKSKLNYPMQTSKKWMQKQKDSGRPLSSDLNPSTAMISSRSQPQVPIMVQYQNALIRENQNVSPFMTTGPDLDPAMATIEAPRKKIKMIALNQDKNGKQVLYQSQSTKYYSEQKLSAEQRMEEQKDKLKFSESITTLKKLKDDKEESKNRPMSSVFKKGTSDFLKRQIMQSIGQQAFETGKFQRSLEKRFDTKVKADNNQSRTFLPIEPFDPLLDIEDPQELIRRYEDPATGKTIGLSKWNFPNGDAELRECFVNCYINKLDLYEIKWCHSREIAKKVSRFNLIFKLEDKDEYERRIFLAHKYRSDAEVLMRYHYLIDNTRIPRERTGRTGQKAQVAAPELLDQTKTRISYLITTNKPYKQFVEARQYKNVQAFFDRDFDERYRNIIFFQRWQELDAAEPERIVQQIHRDMLEEEFNMALLQSLFLELDSDFVRAHRQIYFDLQLPYDKEKYKLLNTVLPAEKFIPISERVANHTKSPALIVLPQRSKNFEWRLDKMSVRLHQGNTEKLKILQMCHMYKQQNLEKRLLQFQFTEPCKLEYLRKEHALSLAKFIRCIGDSQFDCELDANIIIDERQRAIDNENFEAKKQMTYNQESHVDKVIPEEFIISMRKFQRVIQIQFENTMRQVFIASVEQCKDQLRFAMAQVEESTGKSLFQVDERLVDVSHQSAVDDQESSTDKASAKLEKQDILQLSRDAVMQTRFHETQCFQFDITIEYDKDKKEIKANPHAEDWINAIPQHFEASLKSLSEVRCFLSERLGKIRHIKDVGHVVFQDFDPDCTEEYPEHEVSRISFLLQQLFKVLQALLKGCNKYSHILQESTRDYKNGLQKGGKQMNIDDYQHKLNQNKLLEQEIDELFFEDSLRLGPIYARVGDLKKRLKKKINELNQVLLEQIKKKVETCKQQIGEEVDNVLQIIRQRNYKNIEEVTETKNFIKELPEKMKDIKQIIKGVTEKTDVLDENNIYMDEREIVSIWEAFARPMEIEGERGDCSEHLEELTYEFQGDLRLMQEKLSIDILEIQQEFEKIQEYEILASHLEAGKRTEALEERILETIHEAKVCNHRENLFGQNKSDYSDIKIVKENFDPFNKLWALATQYYSRIQLWMNGEIAELDGEALPKDIEIAIYTLKSLKTKHFRQHPHTALVTQELRDLYLQLKPFMPILSSLKNPDFKMAHFDIVQKDHDITIEQSLGQSLKQLEEIGVMNIVDDIIEISAIATKERQLESQLTKMNDEWKSVKFNLTEYRDSDVHILQDVQTIWDLLDEHIQKTLIIASSPYAKFFQSEAIYYKSRLVKVQEILEEWSMAQKGWCYLWPIFSSPDIQGQLPEVYDTFTSVDKIFSNIMQQVQSNPTVLDACTQFVSPDNLRTCNETIEKVKKKLNEYIHSKQLLFPRFFFLSNDDLLHILSQTKDPIRVQDHLNKCFEGIQSLEFNEDLVVTGMVSSMGEVVNFNKIIDPFILKVHKETVEETQKHKSAGQRYQSRTIETVVKEVRAIEDWLSDVEFQMRDSLRSNVINSTSQYGDTPKAKWIFDWPQQVVLAIDQIDWTSRLEKAIKGTTGDSLRFTWRTEERKVNELVDIIRTPNLSKSDMRTLESLIVTDVHSRDTTYELMEQKVSDIESFEWISQLRHYTIMEESGRTRKTKQLEIKISMINSTRYYGFEYQGSQTRLVITPLTDRCYRTLMGALQMNLGGAPEGPAGTGKTETTKDLAKALAKQCLVFNCSDQIDVSTMGKFFKGLACCGAWACFDEFNRIELEVLSVIAQQILTIQTKLMKMRTATSSFVFEEEQITIDSQCAVFITMNPTYAGRSQLPDNLKALFRPVAMMIPNYETIAEIQLYSYGFLNARQLSVKIVQSLKLSSEQLSTQSHYDYGMRAVKSIILASGDFRKMEPEQDEEITVLRAISVCNIPKFINEDINQFNGIISDLFPGIDHKPQEYDLLKHFVELSIEENNLERNEEFETKVVQLYETVQVRHGLMLVGATMGGKTTMTHTLANALTIMEREKLIDQEPVDNNDNDSENSDEDKVCRTDRTQHVKTPKVNIHTINPKSSTIGRLYGDYEKVGDWVDGILATTARNAASDKSGDTHWIMLDGPVDTLWIENLNTVLDDNKKLCLISGEIIKLTPTMTMMFEVEDLMEASPATVSRCGMVYVTPDKLGWEPLVTQWILNLPKGMKENEMDTMYRDLIMAFVPSIIEFLFGKEQSHEEDLRLEGLLPVIKVSKNWLLRSFLNLFESLLLDQDTMETYIEKYDEAQEMIEINKKKKAVLSAGTLEKSDDEDADGMQTNSLRKQLSSKSQKWFDMVDPKSINHIIQKFIMAMIWGFGASLSSPARPKYSLFLHETIQKVFSPSNNTFDFKKRIDMSLFPKSNHNLFTVFFESRHMIWYTWDYEIDKYDILGDKEIEIEPYKHADGSNENESSSEDQGDKSPRSGNIGSIDDLPDKVEFQNIMVATQDSIQQQFIMDMLTRHQHPLLIVGGTGTGKTRAIKKLISYFLDKVKHNGKHGWECGEMVLSATSTPHQIQQYTESQLEKHSRGVYGPKIPSNHLLIFIDDLNMPEKEKFGAQPAIEMVRQIMDCKGFYSEKTQDFNRITRSLFLCAMSTHGSGQSLPSQRLLRHFNLLNFPNMSNETMTRIFQQILNWGFATYHQSWKDQINMMTQLTIEVYQKALLVLLPLPRKAHYLFNMRQVSELIQGLTFVPAEVIQHQKEKVGCLKRLWLHEVMRVFSDRLIDEEDKRMFVRECLNFEGSTFFKDSEIEGAPSLIFCNFVDPNLDNPVYKESKSSDQLRVSLQKIIKNYNQTKSNNRDKMSLLLFEYFLQHLARVSRIIAKPSGNGLLIGLGGNGRKTIAKIATHINDCETYTIELQKNYGQAEWLDNLRTLYKMLGIDNKKMVFQFSDKDIKQETFVEDINNILNVGELTQLFTQEDEQDIIDEIKMQLNKAKVKNITQELIQKYFKTRCRRNLHMILIMSPAGNQLQNYFRKYPSLVNCTSIDWFLPWPIEALKSVSDHYLIKLYDVIEDAQQNIGSNQNEVITPKSSEDQQKQQRELETIAEKLEEGLENASAIPTVNKNTSQQSFMDKQNQSDKQADDSSQLIEEDPEAQEIRNMSIKDRVSRVFTLIHQSAGELTDTYQQDTQKIVYVTPVMFMSLFETFEKLLSRKSMDIEVERSKYDQGIKKLQEAQEMIKEMDAYLQKLQPQLVAKTKQVEKSVKRLQHETTEVMKVKTVVDEETAEAEAEKAEAEGINTECQKALSLAQPFFLQAIKALRTLSPSDFQLLRSYAYPPAGVKLALEGCCIMLGVQPQMKKVDGVKVADYWEKSKKLINNYKKLLDQLENYPKENISLDILRKIQPYLENPNYDPAVIKSASSAAEGLCKWVIAIVRYDKVYKEITPKRAALAEAQQKVEVTQEQLQIKQDQLNKLKEQLAEMQAENEKLQQEKIALFNQKQDASQKLERANALMQSIGSEESRWRSTQKKLEKDKESLLGDMIIATSFVNYLGPYESTYRFKILVDQWQKIVQKYLIKQTDNFSLKETLGDVEKISDWTIGGLPNESMAYENMIIIDETIDKKYPVLIDPEGQAFRYMRENIDAKDQNQDNDQTEMSYRKQLPAQEKLCLKASQAKLSIKLEHALQMGAIVLCENSGEVTHPALLSILRMQPTTIQGMKQVNFNDQQIEFNDSFRIYIFSHLSKPHFSPEVQQLGKVLNFTVTREGLEQQLLQIICQHELSKEEKDRADFAIRTLKLQKTKREVFDQILNTLRTSGDQILESDDFVKTLNQSKETTNEIEKKLKQAKNNEEKIKESRQKFASTAKQGARLYFAVQDLKMLDSMYQFSMSWFRDLFKQTFKVKEPEKEEEEKESGLDENSNISSMMQQIQSMNRRPTELMKNVDMSKKQKLQEMERRANILKNKFREILYRNVCMSLFERHKLLFSFFISLKVHEKDKVFQEGLDRLMKQPMSAKGAEFTKSRLDQSRLDNSSRLSDAKSNNNGRGEPQSAAGQTRTQGSARVSIPNRRQERQGGNVLSRHDSSKLSAYDEERQLIQIEKEKKLAIDESLLKYTLTGLMPVYAEPYEFIENPSTELFSETLWQELHQLTSFQCYETLLEQITAELPLWEKFIKCDKADVAFDLMPEPLQSQLPHFAWIPLIRRLKPELTTLAIRRFVKNTLGAYFTTPIIINLKEVFENSVAHQPILLILTPGNDPMDQISKLSEEKGHLVVPVSLGKGQGEKAKDMIQKSKKTAQWIVLQNCHLSKSFLPELENIIESMQPQLAQSSPSSTPPNADYDPNDGKDSINPGFRIWLTSMSVDYFPQMLLHQSKKLTSEPPKGIKSSMIRTYQSIYSSKRERADFYENHTKPDVWQRLFLSLSFFHAIVRERRRFGPLGWTSQYDFNDSDFRVSMKQLYSMVESSEVVPFKALRYLTGLCNYGGRVTDDRDRRALATILDDFYNEEVISDHVYHFVNKRFKKYFIFKGNSLREYLDFVKVLPDEESPQLMGLHDNAIIQQALIEANTIFKSTLRLTEQSSAGGSSEDSNLMVKKMTETILDGIREPFKIKEVERKYPFKYEESMNGVLLQELARYNMLIVQIKTSLNTLLKTLEGQIVSTAQTDELLTSIKNNMIPENWLKKSYPSIKPLMSYIEDLKKRLSVLDEWIQIGKPNLFWISGFFFTQSFLTGVKQNYARKNQYPIDKVDFQYKVLKFADEAEALSAPPEDGCYLNGLYLEGAAWDDETSTIRESDPKMIHVPVPVMHFVPVYLPSTATMALKPSQSSIISQSSGEETLSPDRSSFIGNKAPNSENSQPQTKCYTYECPTYKTSERAGQLLTTGHNTNYIQMIDLASCEEPSIWIRRGVALLCQLDN